MQGVHVWRATLARSADEVAMLYDLLDTAERCRAAEFRYERDRRRFVVARGTLRILVGKYTGMPPQLVGLRVLPGGKPALEREGGTAGLHFNLSHCGELALFAFADREIGIDVERLAPHGDMARVAAHFFSPEEAVAFGRLVGKERDRFFFRTWVRKEAYVKATGLGFALDPARVRVDDGYSVHDLGDIDDHIAAIAIARDVGVPAIEYREWC